MIKRKRKNSRAIIIMERTRYTIIVFSLIGVICFMMALQIQRMSEEFNAANSAATDDSYYHVIISINVHEKPEFLLKQLENIKENVKCKYAIVLNCNDYMFEECAKLEMPKNVFIHPKPLNKRTFTGTITNGIYNNMMFSLEKFKFEYFVVASSRNFFENSLRDLQEATIINKTYYREVRSWEQKKGEWHWPSFQKTLLLQYVIKNNHLPYLSPHEGLVLTHKGCEKIVEFLESHRDIRDDLFSFESVVEEFSLQTISMMMGENYYYIGNGCCTNEQNGSHGPSPTLLKYMYKTSR